MHQTLGSKCVLSHTRLRYSRWIRKSHLLKREWVLWWCRLGHTRRSSMPIISKCDCWGNSQQILHHHVSVVRPIILSPTPNDTMRGQVLAAARAFEADRRRAFTSPSMESKSILSTSLALFGGVLTLRSCTPQIGHIECLSLHPLTLRCVLLIMLQPRRK